MIEDKNLGIYRPNGASDFEDAPVITSMMVLFDYPAPKRPIRMLDFIDPVTGKYRRCFQPKYDTSRDQTMCLWAGLSAVGYSFLVSIDSVNGKDLFSPGSYGHEARCKGRRASCFQDFFLKQIELRYSARFAPMEELNQIFCVLEIAARSGKVELMKWYCKENPQWADSLRKYWYEGYINEKGQREGNWRDEKDFCDHVIAKIKTRLG